MDASITGQRRHTAQRMASHLPVSWSPGVRVKPSSVSDVSSRHALRARFPETAPTLHTRDKTRPVQFTGLLAARPHSHAFAKPGRKPAHGLRVQSFIFPNSGNLTAYGQSEAG
jgi:hypothetical protein